MSDIEQKPHFDDLGEMDPDLDYGAIIGTEEICEKSELMLKNMTTVEKDQLSPHIKRYMEKCKQNEPDAEQQ